MHHSVVMYEHMASLSVEAMDRANMGMRERFAVCSINVTMVLMGMEKEQFERQKRKAWKHTGFLMPAGGKEMNEIFFNEENPINHCNYQIMVTKNERTISRNVKSLGASTLTRLV